MEKTLFNRNGEAVAYIAADYHETIYLWDGFPVAYLYNEDHIYGINGRHLGRFINEIIYNSSGERVGFTYSACPVPPAKETVKAQKHTPDEIRPRWSAPPHPNLTFRLADQELDDFLKEGRIVRLQEDTSTEPEESDD